MQAPENINLKQEATLKLIVRNTGTSDALNVDVQDELPEGLQYISSQPPMTVTAESHLSARIDILPGGSDRMYTIRVKPTRAEPFDHAATVRFETGCKSRTRVLEPKLKVDVIANPTVGKVLKGQPVEFKVIVTNNGDGPARNVTIRANLTPGLRHESSQNSDAPMVYELTLAELRPGHTETLDSLVADAIVGGDQSCSVVASSPDVVPNKDDSEVTKTIAVVEPKVKLTLKAPDSRYTDTVADYEISVENPGTAAARKIRVVATLPVNGRLTGKLPPDAKYDSATRRLYWTIAQLEAQAKPMTLPFQVRMGGVGRYEVLAEATATGDSRAGIDITRKSWACQTSTSSSAKPSACSTSAARPRSRSGCVTTARKRPPIFRSRPTSPRTSRSGVPEGVEGRESGDAAPGQRGEVRRDPQAGTRQGDGPRHPGARRGRRPQAGDLQGLRHPR